MSYRTVLLDMTAADTAPAIGAMSDAEVETELRAQCGAILSEREGTPPEHIAHARTDDLVTAALAESGQPCGDCGALVVHTDETGWRHVEPSSCFLAQGET